MIYNGMLKKHWKYVWTVTKEKLSFIQGALKHQPSTKATDNNSTLYD